MSDVPAFDLFVDVSQKRQEQIEGLVAYAIYKAAKREWTIAESTRLGRPLRPQESSRFLAMLTNTVEQSFRDDAIAVLTAFAEAALEGERDEIVNEALSDTFWLGVRSGLTAAFFYSILLLSAGLLMTFVGIDIIEVPHKLFTYFHPNSSTGSPKAAEKVD